MGAELTSVTARRRARCGAGRAGLGRILEIESGEQAAEPDELPEAPRVVPGPLAAARRKRTDGEDELNSCEGFCCCRRRRRPRRSGGGGRDVQPPPRE